MDRLTIVLAAIAMALCALAWSAIAKRLIAGMPVLPLEARRPVPWRSTDLVLVGVFFLLVGFGCGAMLSLFIGRASRTDGVVVPQVVVAREQPSDLVLALVAGVVANLATAAFALVWISMHTAVTPKDFGWRRDTLGDDLRLGLVAFAAIAAPVYGLQALLSQFFQEQHPIIEALQRQPSPLFYALAGLSAVVVAPLAEEFFFRVLLQGWLESARWPDDPPVDETYPLAEHRPRSLAIVISSLLFAALHIGHGAAPVPLFFLALALGYLYQRTHRLLPCATVHFCVNACSFAILCLSPSH